MSAAPTAASRSVPLFAAAGLAVPALWSALAAGAVAEPVVSEKAPLAFEQYLLNAGTSDGGGLLRGPFRVTNTGDRPVVIRDVSASCGCLTPEFPAGPLAPGASAEVALRADTAGESTGAKAFYADVSYAYVDAAPSEQFVDRVHLKFFVDRPIVTLAPRQLIVYQATDEPTTQQVTVTDHRDIPYTVTAVTTSRPDLVTAAVVSDGSPEAGVTRVAVTVTRRPAANETVLVRIATDDPARPELYVPVGVTPGGKFPARGAGEEL